MCRCGHAYVHARMCVSEGAVFGLQAPQRGPMCCYQPRGLWDWQWSTETKQFVHFLEASSEQVSQSESVTNGWRGKGRESEGLGMCMCSV